LDFGITAFGSELKVAAFGSELKVKNPKELVSFFFKIARHKKMPIEWL